MRRLFPIVNPIGSAPLFLGLTQFSTDVQRNILARRVAINSFFLLLGSLFVGSHVLGFFGIDLPVVRIGGGLVVDRLRLEAAEFRHPARWRRGRRQIVDLPDAFYPLTMPLDGGTGIDVGGDHPGQPAAQERRSGASGAPGRRGASRASSRSC